MSDLRYALEELARELRARIHTTPSARRENPWVPGGEFTDGKLMTALYARGVRGALLEGGPTLAGAFLAGGLVDEVVGYLAPKLLGAGPAALGPAGVATLSDAFDPQTP